MPSAAAFAIPGDIDSLTGGYIYEKALLEGLRRAGRAVEHIALGPSFPDPTPADEAEALARLRALPAECPVILDGFLSGTLDTAGLAAMAAPFVAMTHHPLALETGLSPDRAAWLEARERANLALAAHVLVPSPHTGAILAERFGVAPERITVAPPGFRRPDGPPVPPETPPLILAVGLLAERKGHDILLEALAGIADLDWQAEIVGGAHDPAVAARLRALRETLGLAGRVRFAGELGRAALDARFARATLFALATRYEGYGMVFAEALLHGLPIVSCRAGAVPDTVPPEAGLLVPPDDPGAFSAALRALLEDDTRRAALAAAAAGAGARLPTWDDTARIAGRVLDAVAAART